MNVYEDFANKLLSRDLNGKEDIFITLKSFGQGRWFGLKYRGYSGLMANTRKRAVTRSHEGYYDFIICTGTRYEDKYGHKPITHYNLFQDLLENSSLENCEKVWIGYAPWDVAKNQEEEQALCSLTLTMFEQEVNWGIESWQCNTNFPPSLVNPYQRPRDMLMGFINMLFNFKDVGRIPNWIYSITKSGNQLPFTPSFGSTGYANYPQKYKKYFECLKEDGRAKPLMHGNTLECFREKAKMAPNNPNYSEGPKHHAFLNRY